jgi:hypothetical protein
MPRAKHKTKPRDNRDFAEVAFDVFQKAIGNSDTQKLEKVKNPAAVELGSKGGKARAQSLSKAKRKAIAKQAAKARWSVRPKRVR